MRLTAPEMAAAYRDGMCSEGATVLDAGQVGTEMLYYLVGSRDLDGGLMCTASHNPKAYTGAKLVGRGAIALSGDAGSTRSATKIEAGLGDPPGGRQVEEVASTTTSSAAALRFIDPQAIRPLRGRRRRRQRHGRTDGRPAARTARARSGRDLLDAGRELPRPRAQPAAAREPRVHHARGHARRGRPRHRLGRRRRPLLLHR